MEDIIKKPHEKSENNNSHTQEDAESAFKKMSGEVLASWEAREYEYIKKSPDWYWMIGIITAGLIAIAVLMKNILFVIIILLGGFVIAMFSAKTPNLVNFVITARGIKINNKLFPYEDLDSFWIHFDPPHKKELGIISKKVLMPRIVIPLGEVDPNDIRENLLKFIEEKHHEESLTESISKLLGF